MADKKYKIKLSEEELKTLHMLTNKTGGFPCSTRRRHMERLGAIIDNKLIYEGETTLGTFSFIINYYDP